MAIDKQPPMSWHVLVAAARGAAHEATGSPMQDAVQLTGDPDDGDGAFVVAVADGHGDKRHFRSRLGAEHAVRVAGAASEEVAMRVALLEQRQDVEALARAELIPTIVERWQRVVLDHAAQNPIGSEASGQGFDVLVAYGTTLLLALISFPWLVLCQIGDGDIVVARGNSAETPVPGDALLDGRRTTSLCQADPVSSFRHAVIDMRDQPADAVLLATDGFGNAQVDDSWYAPVGADIVRMARAHGLAWLRTQLPLWVDQCASAEGSADDTTLALLVRQDLFASTRDPTTDPSPSPNAAVPPGPPLTGDEPEVGRLQGPGRSASNGPWLAS